MDTNQKIQEYLLSNPLKLRADYSETAKLFDSNYETVRRISRKIRKELSTQQVVSPTGYRGNATSGTVWSTYTKDGVKVNEAIRFKVDIDEDRIVDFKEEFIEFLKIHEFKIEVIDERPLEKYKEEGCLIINKQDAHLNKFDVNGDNNINERFSIIEAATLNTLLKSSSIYNLDKIIYVIGSDQFNSEWTNCTTKGTPQQNILSHQEAFKLICEHEIRVINKFLQFSNNVEIIYIVGNHDEFVGFFMVNWLKAFYKDLVSVYIDDTTDYTKCMKYGKTAILLNHGDAQKPRDLAGLFPIKFKEQWSSCDNYVIFTGDKHKELSIDFQGIKFYQLPALSTAKSLWDLKNGYEANKAELTSFVIDKEKGVNLIIKEIL